MRRQQLGKKKKGEDRIFWIHTVQKSTGKCVYLLCGGVLGEEGQLSVPDVVDEAADTNRPGRTICSF